MLNRIERGATVRTQDGDIGSVYQVIVDPDSRDLTHIVVRLMDGSGDLMVPANMVSDADGSTVTLTTTSQELLSMRDDLRYDESQFQSVDPDTVDQGMTHTARGDQQIVDANNEAVEFGGTTGAATETVRYTDTSATEQQAGQRGTGQQRKGKDLLGYPVMSFAEGEQLGKVKDILFDPDQNRVVALLIDEGGWFSSARVVPWQNIRTVGHDSIIVPDRNAEIKADSDPYVKRIMEADNVLSDTQVYSEDGRDLGKIKDMFLDDSTGEVIGYEVSGGMFASTLKGKKFMPAPDTLAVGKHVAFVPNEVAEAMQQQSGGLQAAAQSATSTASENLSAAREKVTSATRDQQRSYVIGKQPSRDVTDDNENVIVAKGETIDQADVDRAESAGKLNALFLAAGGGHASDLLDTARQRTAEQQRSFVIGKQARNDVKDDNGIVIVPAGKTIDEADVQRAEAAGKLNALTAAAGGGAAGGALESVRQQASGLASGVAGQRDQQLTNAIGSTVGRDVYADDGTPVALQGQVVDYATVERARAYGKENQLLAAVGAASAQQSLTDAKEGIAGAFSGIKTRIDEFQREQQEKNEERRIKNAVGRPVTRVILDRQDNVILETAQIVTWQAIDRARAAGVLDILLSSVYDEEPQLSPEALHSGKSGQASIDAKYEQQRKPQEPIT